MENSKAVKCGARTKIVFLNQQSTKSATRQLGEYADAEDACANYNDVEARLFCEFGISIHCKTEQVMGCSYQLLLFGSRLLTFILS